MDRELEEVGSHTKWRNCVRDVHDEGWHEEVEEKSSLKWYRLAKEEDFGQERYVKKFSSKGEVRLRLRGRYQWGSWVTRRVVLYVMCSM